MKPLTKKEWEVFSAVSEEIYARAKVRAEDARIVANQLDPDGARGYIDNNDWPVLAAYQLDIAADVMEQAAEQAIRDARNAIANIGAKPRGDKQESGADND